MFVLLKLLLHLFRPLLWIFFLLLYGLLTKQARRKSLAFRTALGLLVFFTNPFIIRKLVSLYETPPQELQANQKFNTGILLGGLVSYEPADDRGYFNRASDRFIETALLYKQGHLANVVVAAGNGYITRNNFHEADFIKAKLVTLGIPAERIFTDAASRNTLENAAFARRLTDSVSLTGPYLLISSAMHLPRAATVFRKAGINAVLYPCDFAVKGAGNNFLEDYLLPSSRAFDLWDNYLKELVGTLVYRITGKG